MICRTLMQKPLWKRSSILISLGLFLWATPLFAGHIYTYVDRNGVLHITDLWRGGSAPVRESPMPPASVDEIIQEAAQREGLDPALVRAVIQVESGFNPGALSPKGAIGLMQLLPETASLYGAHDPWDTVQNIFAGTAYLRDLIQHFNGDLVKALAAYNAGPKAVEDYNGIPPFPETQQYVMEILSLYSTRNVEPGNTPTPEALPRPIRRIRLPDGTILYTNMPQS